jgi:hypothetical protein
MINSMRVRSLYESRTRESGGRKRFVEEIRHNLGLSDANGNDHRDLAGNKKLGERSIRPEQFSLRELAEAIIGPSWRVICDDSHRSQFAAIQRARSLAEAAGTTNSLMESTGVGLDPTAFLNINAFSSVVGGLIEVKILEAFQNPELIADSLAPAERTRLNGQKVIGLNPIGDSAKKRLPGETHTRVQFGERYVTTPETRENALAIDVNKETVFFDLTGDVLNMATSVGEALAYRKELEVINTVIGGVNTFNWNGAAYNTFQTSKTLGFTNSITNQLIDWESLQTDLLQFSRQEDPDTAKRILIRPNTILVNPAKLVTANLIVGANAMERRTAPGATQATAVALSVAQGAPNPYSGQFNIVTSPLLEQQCLATVANGGLALSLSDANNTWWMMESGKAFRYMQNYPLTVTQAAPNQYEMLDRGILASYFANERGIPAVISPWHIIKNTP